MKRKMKQLHHHQHHHYKQLQTGSVQLTQQTLPFEVISKTIFKITRQSDGSLPFPPPPISSKEASPESSPEISIAKLIRFPLKSKSKNSPDTTNEQHPDLCVNNGVPVETNRIATIRKPHTPLKCPSISKNVGLVVIICEGQIGQNQNIFLLRTETKPNCRPNRNKSPIYDDWRLGL